MWHFREDYNRIQDPESKIAEDEPVVLFRAKDRFFIAVVCFYMICNCIFLFQDGRYFNSARRMIKLCINGLKRTIDWYDTNSNYKKVKYPDAD